MAREHDGSAHGPARTEGPHGPARTEGAADAAAQPGRELPAHMAAQLRSAGREADTAGQPWRGRDLGHGHDHLFTGDDGGADDELTRALADRRAGTGDEARVISALAGSRVFVPVLAEVSHSTLTDDGLVADKEADMALVTLSSRGGRRTQPVFASDTAVTAWHPRARPVAADARRVALAAVKDGAELLVLDPGSEAPFVVRRPALWAIAQGRSWTPSYRDRRVARAVLDAALGLPGVAGASVRPGRGIDTATDDGAAVPGGGEGPELTVVLQLLPGMDRAELGVVVEAFQEALASQPVIADEVDSLEISLETARL